MLRVSLFLFALLFALVVSNPDRWGHHDDSSDSSDDCDGDCDCECEQTEVLKSFNFQGCDVYNTSSNFFYYTAGDYVANDGIETMTDKGLRITARPIRKTTTQTPGGSLDQIKYLSYMAGSLDATVPYSEVACEGRFSGRTFGTENHPFGDLVQNANDDPRLGIADVNVLDFTSLVSVDFAFTNERIWAIYERLPGGRTPENNYASFSFIVPLVARTPGQIHDLKIAYNKTAGTIRWVIDDEEVFRINKIGYRISREYMLFDRGGQEQIVSPDSINCGLGIFVILDSYSPCNVMNTTASGATVCQFPPNDKGLVRLDTNPYWDPRVGKPISAEFSDNDSLDSNRIFGQGAQLHAVEYRQTRTVFN